jgi:hypothetical protein
MSASWRHADTNGVYVPQATAAASVVRYSSLAIPKGKFIRTLALSGCWQKSAPTIGVKTEYLLVNGSRFQTENCIDGLGTWQRVGHH